MTHQAAAQMRPPATPEEYALFYAWMGWPVLPVANRGKAPLTKHGVKDATTDPAVIRHWWKQWPDANIGIAMGQVAGVWCLDIDPRNGGDASLDALIDKLGLLPDTIEALTGGGGRHIIFRYPDGTRIPKRKLADGIDLISDGGYILVEPSIHPSGTAYTWEASSSPVDGRIAIEAPAPLLALVCAAPEVATLPMPDAAPLEPAKVREVRSALAFVPADDRDCWLKVGMALHATRAGNAYGLWVEWSQQSEKFNARDQGRVWRSFKPHEGITLSTLFALAKHHGWQDLEQPTPVAQVQMYAETAAEQDLKSLPPHLLTPPGILGDIAAYYNATARVPQPGFAVQTALALGSVLLGRRFITTANNSPSLYFLNVAKSASGKEHGKTVIEAVLESLNEERLIAGDGYTSAGAVLSTLLQKPTHITVIDEAGKYLEAAKDKGGYLARSANKALMESIGRAHGTFRTQNYSNMAGQSGGDKKVLLPSITLLAMTTPSTFYNCLTPEQIADGFLGRFIMHRSYLPRQVPNFAPMDVPPPSIGDWFTAIRGRLDGNLADAAVHSAEMEPPLARLDIAPAASVLFREFAQEMIALMDSLEREGLEELAGRTSEFAMRLALILALARDPYSTQVLAQDARWAIDYMRFAIQQTIYEIRQNMAGSQVEADRQTVLKAIRSAGVTGLTDREARRTSPCSRFDAMTFTRLVRELMEAGFVAQVNVREGKPGKPRVAYIAIMDESANWHELANENDKSTP